jgi:hypothetical protein
MQSKLERLIPDSEQEAAIVKTISEDTKACLNASLMGVGKSLMAVEVAIRLEVDTKLIIAPLGTYWGWWDTIQRQTGYESNIERIDSSKTGKEAFENLKAKKPGWYIVGREYFRRLEWDKVVPDIAIIDEVHFAQNRQSKSFKTLMKLKPKFRLALSGTPAGNRFEGMWAITRWLWPTIIPKSFWGWVYDWCRTGYSPFSQMEILGEKNPGEFAKSLPCYIRLEPAKEIETRYEPRYVELVPAQKKIYDKFQKDLVVWLGENPMVAEVPIAARIRLRQITLATPSITETGEVVFEDDAVSTKYKALQEIIDDNPDDAMLLLTDSQKFASLVTKRLNSNKVQAFEWSGKATQPQREEAKQLFMKGGLKYIVAVIPAIAEGVDGLQNICSTVVWLSHSDSNVLNQQVLDRVRRRGQKEIVNVYDIIARNTFDEGQLSTLVQRQLEMNASLRKEK